MNESNGKSQSEFSRCHCQTLIMIQIFFKPVKDKMFPAFRPGSDNDGNLAFSKTRNFEISSPLNKIEFNKPYPSM